MATTQTSQIRNEVKDLYPHSMSWHNRVDRMFDQQVYAIWKTHQEMEQRAIDKEVEISRNQLTLF